MDETQLQYIFKLAEENLKITIWKYNETCYLITNGEQLMIMQLVNLKLRVTLKLLILQKVCLTYWIQHFINMNLKSLKELLKDIQIIKFINLIKLLYIEPDYQNLVLRQSQNHLVF